MGKKSDYSPEAWARQLEYHRRRRSADGFKAKQREYQNKYNEKNRDRVRANQKKYWTENHDRLLEKQRIWQAANRDKIRGFQLKQLYGVTLEWYRKTLESQNYRCAICASDKPGGKGCFNVDHDHQTGAVRGLLCHACNTAIGIMRDDPSILEKAAQYLRSHADAKP